MPKRGALLDAGAQNEKVIMRRVLEQGYEIYKFPVDVPFEKIKDYDFYIVSGGPRSVYNDDVALPAPELYSSEKPGLFICFGAQAAAYQLGGEVKRGLKGQYGRAYVDILNEGPLFEGLASRERVEMNHFDVISKIPKDYELYATSDGITAAFGSEDENIFGVQFHPEMSPITKNAKKMFKNFFKNACGFPEADKRTIADEVRYAEEYIRNTVGDKHVLWYWSVGTDSSVGVRLSSRVMDPEKLHVRFLDTGVMRRGEREEAIELADEMGLYDFKVLDVKDRFYDSIREIDTKQEPVLAGPLCYTLDPEYKRKIFGTEYAVVALTEIAHIAHKLGIPKEMFLLGQGTLRPDLIESSDERATMGNADVIKTHHNAVKALKMIPKLEPLTELFKDQVREMAVYIGLPEKTAYRQPNPGPSFYPRIIGSDGQFCADEIYALAGVVESKAEEFGFNGVPLPIKSVGVQGDERSFKYAVLLTGKPDWDNYLEAALAMPNEIGAINRVLYSPGRSPSLKEACSLTVTYNTHDVIDQIRECDFVMRQIAEKYGFNDSRRCSQMPGILIPINFGVDSYRSFGIRPVHTEDFVALIGMMPHKNPDDLPAAERVEYIPEMMLFEMALEIPRRVKGIERVILDSTDKPPGSTEWE